MVFAHAMGHLEGGDDPKVAPVWGLPRSVGPAGLITATATDVLAFARMHLNGGLAADGTRVLSEASVTAMADYQTDCPEKLLLGDSWGLGWFRCDWNGHRAIGHDGNTIGQAAFLRLLPEAGLAVSLNTNIGSAIPLFQDLYEEIFAELADVRLPDRFEVPSEPVDIDATPYVGTYARESVTEEVFIEDGKPFIRITVSGPVAEHRGRRAGDPRADPGVRRAVRDEARQERGLLPGPLLLPADRRGVPPLRRPGHPEEVLMVISLCRRGGRPRPAARRRARARRGRVAVERPRRGRCLRRGRGAARGAPARGRARSGSSIDGVVHLRWRFGAGPDPGAPARSPRHGVADRDAGGPPVRRWSTACCAGPVAST